MSIKLLLLFAIFSFSLPNAFARDNGDVKETQGKLTVWSVDSARWVSPVIFFEIEIKKLKGPTFGQVTEYPPYASVKEWDTLIDQLSDGRICPMVFFHKRWRRLPDVLALDQRLRDYGGCRDVFGD